MPFGRAHISQKDKTMSGGVTDIGQGLHALAAALSDPETIAAYQDEDTGKQYSRTFYHGMHEISHGIHDAGDGIAQLAQALHHCGDSFASVANSIHSLATSVQGLQGAIQPLSKSINHIAAGATAVGLTFAFGTSGVRALLLGISLLVFFTYVFHKLL